MGNSFCVSINTDTHIYQSSTLQNNNK